MNYSDLLSIFKQKPTKIVADCGHETLVEDVVTAFGTKCKIKLPVIDGGTAYCHKCIEKMTIRCAWCNKPIFIGDPVTLYIQNDQDFHIPKHAITYSKDPLQIVGCLRWNCANSGADIAGIWIPPGKVHCVPTTYEILIQKGGGVITGEEVAKWQFVKQPKK